MEHHHFQAREGLNLFTPEDRHNAYKALGIEVIVHADGMVELTGRAVVDAANSDLELAPIGW